MSDDESSVQFRDESESESVQFNPVADDDDDDSVAFHELESDRENPSFRQQPGSWFFRRGSSRSMTPSGNASVVAPAPGQKTSTAQIRSASSDTSPQPSPRETASSPQMGEHPPATAVPDKPTTPAAPAGATIRSGTPPTQMLTEASSKDRENSGNQPKPKKSVVANRLAEKPLTSGNGSRRVPPSRGRNGSASSMEGETDARESPKKNAPKPAEVGSATKEQESASSAQVMKIDIGAANVGGTAKSVEIESNKPKPEESATQSKGKAEAVSHIRQSSATPLTRQATGTFEASADAPSGGSEKQPSQPQQHPTARSGPQVPPEIASYAKQSRESSPERVVTEEELNEAKEVTTSTRRFRKQQEKELALVTARLQEAQGAVAVAPSFIPLREKEKRYSAAVPGINPRPRSESPGSRPQSGPHDGHTRAGSSHGKASQQEVLGATVPGRLGGDRSTGGPRPELGPPIPTGRSSHIDPRRTSSPTKQGRQGTGSPSESLPIATFQASGLPHGPSQLKTPNPSSTHHAAHSAHSVDRKSATLGQSERPIAAQSAFVSSSNGHKGGKPSPATTPECKICESQKHSATNTNGTGKRNSQQGTPTVSLESLALKVAAERQLLVPDEAFPIDSIDGLRTNLPWFRLNGVKASSREVEAFVRGVKRLVAQQRGASPSQAAAEYPSPVRAGRKQPQPPRRSNTSSLRAVFELLDVCQRGYLVVKHLHAALHQISAARGKEPASFEECFAIDVVMPALAEEGAGFPEVDFPTMSQIVLQYLDHNEHTQIRSTLGPIYTPRQYLEALA